MHNSRTDMRPVARSLSHAMGSYLRRIAVHRRPLAKILVLFPIKHSAYLFYPSSSNSSSTASFPRAAST